MAKFDIKTKLNATSEADFEAFTGPNWDHYGPALQELRNDKAPKFDLKKYNWLAVFLAPVWFLYRKLWIYLVIYFVAAYALSYALSLIHVNIPAVVYGVVIAFASRLIYLNYAADKIAEIRRTALDDADARAKIAAAGGVSPVAAWIGVAVIVVLAALVILATLSAAPAGSGTVIQ